MLPSSANDSLRGNVTPRRDTTVARRARVTTAEKDMKALQTIRQLDYTVLYVRNMEQQRFFYGTVMQFPLRRELGPQWVEFQVGSNVLALTQRGLMFDDPAPPPATLAVQLAFRVAPADVSACERELQECGVAIERTTTDQPWGHRTLFVRDADGNVVEIYADL